MGKIKLSDFQKFEIEQIDKAHYTNPIFCIFLLFCIFIIIIKFFN